MAGLCASHGSSGVYRWSDLCFYAWGRYTITDYMRSWTNPGSGYLLLNSADGNHMSAPKKHKNPRSRRLAGKSAARSVPVVISGGLAVEVPAPTPTTDVVTEKTYITREPEVEIRKPATLAQALTEPAVAVVKPKSTVRKEVVDRTRRSA